MARKEYKLSLKVVSDRELAPAEQEALEIFLSAALPDEIAKVLPGKPVSEADFEETMYGWGGCEALTSAEVLNEAISSLRETVSYLDFSFEY